MERRNRARKYGYETRDQTAGHLIDYSDTDIVDDDGNVIAELWNLCASTFDLAMGCTRRDAPGLMDFARVDEYIKIQTEYLTIEQIFSLYEVVREWAKELNPPRVYIKGLEVANVTGIIDKEDEERIDFIKGQLKLKKAIIELTDEFRKLQGKVDNVLYTYEGLV